MSELPWLYYLIRAAVTSGHNANRILDRYPISICKHHLHKQNARFLLPVVHLLFSKPPCTAYSQVCAWWMSDQQIPSPNNAYLLPPPRDKRAIAIQQRKNIAHDMPLRVPTRAVLQIAGIRFMPTFPECFAHFLGFFAGN